MAEIRIPNIDEDGNFLNLEVNTRLAAKFGGAAVYNSGPINLTANLATGWTSVVAITVQRYGKVVSVDVRDAKQTGLTGNAPLVTLPLGFRPPAAKYDRSYIGTQYFLDTAGVLTVRNPGAAEYLSLTYITDDQPPA